MNEFDCADVFECGLCGCCGDSVEVARHLGDVHQVLRDEETLVGLPMRTVQTRHSLRAAQNSASAIMLLPAPECPAAAEGH